MYAMKMEKNFPTGNMNEVYNYIRTIFQHSTSSSSTVVACVIHKTRQNNISSILFILFCTSFYIKYLQYKNKSKKFGSLCLRYALVKVIRKGLTI